MEGMPWADDDPFKISWSSAHQQSVRPKVAWRLLGYFCRACTRWKVNGEEPELTPFSYMSLFVWLTCPKSKLLKAISKQPITRDHTENMKAGRKTVWGLWGRWGCSARSGSSKGAICIVRRKPNKCLLHVLCGADRSPMYPDDEKSGRGHKTSVLTHSWWGFKHKVG